MLQIPLLKLLVEVDFEFAFGLAKLLESVKVTALVTRLAPPFDSAGWSSLVKAKGLATRLGWATEKARAMPMEADRSGRVFRSQVACTAHYQLILHTQGTFPAHRLAVHLVYGDWCRLWRTKCRLRQLAPIGRVQLA